MSFAALSTRHRFGFNFIVLAMVATLTACSSLPGLGYFGSGGEVTYSGWSWCVPLKLKRVLRQVAQKYGDVNVQSSYRSWWHNWRVGGAKKSLHRRCRAVDFSVAGDIYAAYRFVQNHPSVGGRKLYSAGFIHIDTGAKRTW